MIHIMTRFNLGEYREVWTKTRLEIMKKWLFPSIKTQTSKNFKFYLIINYKTHKSIKREIEFLMPECVILLDTRKGNFKEKLSIVEDCGWIDDFRKMVEGETCLVTARVDSDDFLLPDFVKNIEENIPDDECVLETPHLFINNDHGNYWINRQLPGTEERYSASPACVAVERGTYETVLRCAHTKLFKFWEIRLLDKLSWGRNMHEKRGFNDFLHTKATEVKLFEGKFDGFEDFVVDNTVSGILLGEIDFNE